MRLASTALLAGMSSLLFAGAVAAQGVPTHRITIPLPDGTVEQIDYAGNVAPEIGFLPAPPTAAALAAPVWGFGPDSPFLEMQRISAAMNREAATLWHQAAAMMARPWPTPNEIMRIDAAGLPPGARGYRFVAIASPGGFCGESMEIIEEGPGHRPRVVTHRAGDCAAAASRGAMPDAAPAVASPPGTAASPVRSVKATAPAPFAAPARQVAWNTRY